MGNWLPDSPSVTLLIKSSVRSRLSRVITGACQGVRSASGCAAAPSDDATERDFKTPSLLVEHWQLPRRGQGHVLSPIAGTLPAAEYRLKRMRDLDRDALRPETRPTDQLADATTSRCACASAIASATRCSRSRELPAGRRRGERAPGARRQHARSSDTPSFGVIPSACAASTSGMPSRTRSQRACST